MSKQIRRLRVSPKQLAEIKKRSQATESTRVAKRLTCLLMKIQGRSHQEVAEVLLVSVNTVTRWLGIYVKEGLEALCTMHWQGDPGELSNEQLEALKSELRSKTYRNAKQVQDYIAKTFDVEYSVRGVQDLLHRLGFTYHQSALIASRADPEAQERFVEEYFELRDQLDEGGRVFFR